MQVQVVLNVPWLPQITTDLIVQRNATSRRLVFQPEEEVIYPHVMNNTRCLNAYAMRARIFCRVI